MPLDESIRLSTHNVSAAAPLHAAAPAVDAGISRVGNDRENKWLEAVISEKFMQKISMKKGRQFMIEDMKGALLGLYVVQKGLIAKIAYPGIYKPENVIQKDSECILSVYGPRSVFFIDEIEGCEGIGYRAVADSEIYFASLGDTFFLMEHSAAVRKGILQAVYGDFLGTGEFLGIWKRRDKHGKGNIEHRAWTVVTSLINAIGYMDDNHIYIDVDREFIAMLVGCTGETVSGILNCSYKGCKNKYFKGAYLNYDITRQRIIFSKKGYYSNLESLVKP